VRVIPSYAAQALAILLAVLLLCAPLCQPSTCTRACCPSHSGDCQAAIDLNASACASRAVPASASASDPLHPTLLPASLDAAQSLAIQRSHHSITRLHLAAPPAPTPPLRI